MKLRPTHQLLLKQWWLPLWFQLLRMLLACAFSAAVCCGLADTA